MRTKILYIERNFWKNAGIEQVFRTLAENLNSDRFTTEFQTVKYKSSVTDTLKNILFFKTKKADIYHITGQIHYIALLLPRERTVLTIHDLIFLHTKKGLRRYILKKLFLDIPVRRLRYITAISEFTKQEIIRHSGCAPEKIKVIENPLFEQFTVGAEYKFNARHPLILQIGTALNKNLDNLVEALRGLKCGLKIIGRIDNRLREKIKSYKIDFQNEYDLSEEQIIEEYRKADVISFCSTYEGFGLPIIEAQALRRLVITSNISPLKEVAGDGAFLVNPFDTTDMHSGFREVFNNERLRRKLISNGLRNIKRFSARKIAGQYEGFYKDILT